MAGIWIYHRDDAGAVSSVSIVVIPCSGEPAETLNRHAADRLEPLSHGLAEHVVANGCDEPLAFCRACFMAWKAEEARQARLRAVLPIHRAWLEARGIRDWHPKAREAR